MDTMIDLNITALTRLIEHADIYDTFLEKFSAAMQAVKVGEPPAMFGIGAYSCAAWINDPSETDDGKSWIMGYWTATNMMNRLSHRVGAAPDAKGILLRSEMPAQPIPRKPSLRLRGSSTRRCGTR
jgi:hypothetical protein